MSYIGDKKISLLAIGESAGSGGGSSGSCDCSGKIISTEYVGKDIDGGNIYRQTFEDGTTAEFVAPKGDQGIQGKQGEKGDGGSKLVSIENTGLDASGGSIYLMTFDDGTTAQIVVPKGEQGEGVNSLFDTIYSTNLLDLTQIEQGVYLGTNGVLATNTGYCTSGFIPCKAGDTIRYQMNYGTTRFDATEKSYIGMKFACAFDSNKEPISTSWARDIDTFTCPEDTAFVRVSWSTTDFTNETSSQWAIVIGDTAAVLPYEEYKETLILKPENNNDEHISKLIEKATGDTINEMYFEDSYSNNLLDMSQIEIGYYMTANGVKYSNASYFLTGYIPVKEGETLYVQKCTTSPYMHSFRFLAAFDSDKNVLPDYGHSGNGLNSYTVPSGVSYIRATLYYYDNEEYAMITHSPTVIDYEEYAVKKVLKPDNNNDDHINNLIDYKVGNVVDAYLPTDIYCAVGRTIELYNNQVCLQANKYHLRWNCTIGKALSRKFSVTGLASQIGTYPVTLEIYNDNLEVLWTGNTTLHIVASTISTTKSVCPIGDSITNAKCWAAEVINLSAGKISYVGTYSTTQKDADGNWRTYGHEGRSGFSSRGYNSATVYTFGGETEPHAFWDGTRFNWSYYKTNSGINPDCVQIFLGTNGIKNDNTENAGNIKQMVDYIRQDDANIPIFVVNTIYRGTQNGMGVQQSNDGYASAAGVFKYNEDKKVMDLMKKLDALLADYDGVYMINLALTHDSEYNFGAVATAVNPRASQTELMPTESVHPQTQGYLQMADVIYSVYCAALG